MLTQWLSPALWTPIIAALVLPGAVASQSFEDLPLQDQLLTVEEEVIFSFGAIAGNDWENLSTVTGVAFDAEGNLYILDGLPLNRRIRCAPGSCEAADHAVTPTTDDNNASPN